MINYSLISKVWLPIFTILTFVSLNSQTIIKGRIIDSLTKDQIPFASVVLEGFPVWTSANKSGNFSLSLKKHYKAKLLKISSLGYKSKTVSIKDLNLTKINTIKLAQELTLLSEVLITSSLDANTIVKKAFDNYYKNFSDKPFLAKGHFRHIEKTKSEYKWLVEAAISTYDKGYHSNANGIKINIDASRKSFDNRAIDSRLVYVLYLWKHKGMRHKKANKIAVDKLYTDKEFETALNHYDNRRSSLSSFIKDDNLIRRYNHKNSILDKNVLKKHSFKLDTSFYDNDRLLHKIKISPSKSKINLTKQLKKYYLPVGWIYIYGDDYSIKELNYSLVASEKQKETSRFFGGSIIKFSSTYKFTQFNGKTYLKYFSIIRPKNVNASASESYILNNSLDDFSYQKREVLFTEIVVDETIINTEIKNKIWDDDLFKKRPYNKLFWDSYNILLEPEEEKQMIHDLEKKVSLKKQFEQQ